MHAFAGGRIGLRLEGNLVFVLRLIQTSSLRCVYYQSLIMSQLPRESHIHLCDVLQVRPTVGDGPDRPSIKAVVMRKCTTAPVSSVTLRSPSPTAEC